MKSEYVIPALDLDAFNCVRCHVYTHQFWSFLRSSSRSDGFGSAQQIDTFRVSICSRCGQPTIWHTNGKIIFPNNSIAEPPNQDLPPDVQQDYEEARSIANHSPRGAAALLRLAVQKLCKHLGQPGENINKDIKALVAAGLPPKVQQALDSVRVIGNDCVHPGSLDLRDDVETVNKLFKLVNIIAAKMITEPKEIDEIYNSLPQSKIDAINERDSKP